MALIVSDANIFIDLDCAGLTARMFRLDIEFATPDLLYQEELSQYHPELPGYGLQIRPLEPKLISRSVAFRKAYPKLSVYDAFTLVLAEHETAPLLTGDRHLRKAAANEGVQVYGTLWLMEEMLNNRLLTLSEMKAAYDLMLAAQSRLPFADINRQIKRLSE